MSDFRWEKLGLVFSPKMVADRPWWLDQFAQAPAALKLEDRIRMYFSCRPRPDSNGQFVSHTAFVDLALDDPTTVISVASEPVIDLGDIGAFDQFGVYPFSVIQRGAEVWAYYGGWTRCESVPFNVAIGVARSTDKGETFQRVGPGPVLSYTPDEPFILSGPKIRQFGGRFFLFYIAGSKWLATDDGPEPVYRIRMATSDDGLTWERDGRDLIAPKILPDEAQASPDVSYFGGRYHMFFCYRSSVNYRSGPGSYRIGYAWSANLIDWVREDKAAGIDVSASGWDDDMVAYPHVFETAGNRFMAYLGNSVGREGFGLARLRA